MNSTVVRFERGNGFILQKFFFGRREPSFGCNPGLPKRPAGVVKNQITASSEASMQHRHRIKGLRIRAGHSHGGERIIEVHTKKRQQKCGRATGSYLTRFAVNQH